MDRQYKPFSSDSILARDFGYPIWETLYYRANFMKLLIKLESITRKEIQWAIEDNIWQGFRLGMIGTTLKEKIETLNQYWILNQNRKTKIQIINYINALKRSNYSKQINNYLI